MKSFLLKVYCTDKTLFEGNCNSLVVPIDDGLYGVQAGHSNTICAVVAGEMKIVTPNGEVIFASLSEGMMKIEDNEVLILLDTADIIRKERTAK